MSDKEHKRETIVAFTGSADDGNAWLQAAWLDPQIEITVTEEKGADSSAVCPKPRQWIWLAWLPAPFCE
jgi:hypothetical protein